MSITWGELKTLVEKRGAKDEMDIEQIVIYTYDIVDDLRVEIDADTNSLTVY